MRELESTLQEHLCQIAQIKLVWRLLLNDKQYTIGRLFKKVERRFGSLIEGAFAH
jgi:hypothetical protein